MSAGLFAVGTASVPPVHTERSMIARLDVRYGATYRNGSFVGRRYARAEKVGNTAGFAGPGSRIADYIATDVFSVPFPERTAAEIAAHLGYGVASVIGHEIKVSRADYLAELRHLTKADAWSRYCNYWWIVAPKGVVRADLPDGWGLLVPHGPSLKVNVRARRKDAEPMPGHVVASLARAIVRTEARIAS